jgi:hypothetical protein
MPKAFLRSVMWWQEAMLSAAQHPNPFGLFNGVDIEEAAGRLSEARKWLDIISVMERSMTKMVSEGEERGCDERELAKYRDLISNLSLARKHAQEHLDALTKKATARAARRGRAG